MRIAVTLIDQVIHSVVSENGHHMVLSLADADGQKLTLGIPCVTVPQLIDASARALADSERVLRRGWDPRTQLDVTWWNLSRDEAREGLLLSLTFGSGGTLNFELPYRMASILQSCLAEHLATTQLNERGFGSYAPPNSKVCRTSGSASALHTGLDVGAQRPLKIRQSRAGSGISRLLRCGFEPVRPRFPLIFAGVTQFT